MALSAQAAPPMPSSAHVPGSTTECPKCGYANAARAKFCRSCGASMSGAEIEPTRTPEQDSSHMRSAAPDPASARSGPSGRAIGWVLVFVVLAGLAGSGYYGYQQFEEKRIAEEKAAAEAARQAEEKRVAEELEKQRLRDEAQQAKAREESARREAAVAQARLAREKEQAENARKAAEAQAEAARRAAAEAQAKSAQTRQTTASAGAKSASSNDSCSGAQGLQREICTSCAAQSGLLKIVCQERARSRYCAGKRTAECQ